VESAAESTVIITMEYRRPRDSRQRHKKDKPNLALEPTAFPQVRGLSEPAITVDVRPPDRTARRTG
jgi:hypothetical protein